MFPEQAAAGFCGSNGLDNPRVYNEAVLPDGVLAFQSRRALDTILTQIPERISIANFLWELKDGVRSLLPRLVHGLGAYGGAWLWWNFAALPLVRDLMALLTLVADVNKRLDYLRKVNGQTVTVNYRGHWSGYNDYSGDAWEAQIAAHNDEWNPSEVQNDFGLWRISWDEFDFSLQARVNYDLDLKGADAFMAAMCAALGLLNPAQIVWNAIPYSFVVDWLTNVSEWLENNIDVAQPFEGTIRMLGCNHSIKRRTLFEHWALTSNRNTAEMYGRTLVRAYHRRAGIFGGQIDTEGLTDSQQLLATALLTQGLGTGPLIRRRRIRRPRGLS
jgi:hypothetical protein